MASKYDKYVEEIKKDYASGVLTIQEINEKYGIKSHCFVSGVIGKEKRNRSDINRLARKKRPESYKRTEATKQKLREARYRFLEEHPEETAWRKRNKPSYPEKCFISFLKEKRYDTKYYIEREYPVFPYYIDFAFVNEKLAVEIDGSQHLEENRKEKDLKKDSVLLSNGWKILRITEKIVKTDWDMIEKKLNELLVDVNIKYERVGLLTHRKPIKTREERDEYGRTEKQNTCFLSYRVVKDRPSKEELFGLLKQYKNFVEVGKMFNVSDNAIRKWCKWYKIPHSIKYYKGL